MLKLRFVLIISMLFLFSGCNDTILALNDKLNVSIVEPLDSMHGEFVLMADPLWEELHNGNLYEITGNTTLDLGDEVSLIACTPDNNTWIHFSSYQVSASNGNIALYFNENISYTGGNTVVGYDLNRRTSNNHKLNLTYNPTITNQGNNLFVISAPGSSNNQISSSAKRDVLSILNYDMCYSLVIVNNDGVGNDISYSIVWFEEE